MTTPIITKKNTQIHIKQPIKTKKMTATSKLAEFIHKLPEHLHAEFRELVDAVADERDRLQNERIATSHATTGKYEVVAIAGTAETLLNDAINVGDTVCAICDSYPNTQLEFAPILKGTTLKVDTRFSDKVSFENYYHSYNVRDFRKVSTPLINPLNSVEGC